MPRCYLDNGALAEIGHRSARWVLRCRAITFENGALRRFSRCRDDRAAGSRWCRLERPFANGASHGPREAGSTDLPRVLTVQKWAAGVSCHRYRLSLLVSHLRYALLPLISGAVGGTIRVRGLDTHSSAPH